MSDCYQVVEGSSFEQGDIIKHFTVLVPEYSTDESISIVGKKEITGIIVTQSCDLIKSKYPFAHICPIYPLSHFSSGAIGKDAKLKEAIRRRYVHSYCMLGDCQLHNHEMEIGLVDLREVYTIPLPYLISKYLSTQRLRLLSPYKEYFAQSFSNNFGRVGLPKEVGQFHNGSPLISSEALDGF